MPGSISPVSSMFSRISGVYDFLNHFLSLGIDRRWRKKLVEITLPENSGLVLDLAAGTLDVAVQLAKSAPVKVIAIDFCFKMLKQGDRKIGSAHLEKKIFPCCGDALALPLPDSSVKSITIAFGIRNIPARQDAFNEMFRVLEPGGKLGILEFGSGKEKIWGGIYNFYLNSMLPFFGLAIGKDKKAYGYLAKTIREFPPAQTLGEELNKAGFHKVNWEKLTSGIVYIHSAKKPE